MSYYNQLNPWCIVRCLPNAQTLIVARLRRRPDAEAHLRILQQLSPTAIYQILFDVREHPSQDDRPQAHCIDAQCQQLPPDPTFLMSSNPNHNL